MTTSSAGSSTGPPPIPARTMRPVLVWVVSIYYLFAATASVVKMWSLLAASEQLLDARGQPYTAFDYVESLVLAGLKVASAVMLFRLSRKAVVLLLAVLTLNVVATGYELLTRGLPPPGGPLMLVSIAIAIGILAAAYVYAWRLQTKGVLK